MKRTVVLATLAFLLLSAAAFGQAQKGSISVTVLDTDGGAIPGATIEAVSVDTLSRRVEITGETGTATLRGLDPAQNYVVTTTIDGFNGARNENVLVKAGANTPIRVTLSLATVTEEVLVTAESPVVDIRSAATGQEITLDLVESLPTARTYQDYLQLVPGVMPSVTDFNGNNNPASRSGTNYQDIGGRVGDSRDNFYYFEGIDVTDSVSGVAGAFINTEIIQEQSVFTGGLPAEFVGASGLVSNVITKSGGNSFSGSLNYYFQNDSLVESNKHRQDAGVDTFDTAFTLGGPIVQDKAWFFTSFRLVEEERDVVTTSGLKLRTPTRQDDQGFAKISWSPTDSGLLTGIYLTDEWDRNGNFDPSVPNNEDETVKRGGDRFTGTYSHVFSNLVAELGYGEHERDLNDLPVNQDTFNAISFRGGDVPSDPNLLQLGGAGVNFEETRGAETLRGSLEYLADTSWGSHTIKFGVELAEKNDFRNFVNTGDGGVYTSLSSIYLGQGVDGQEVSDLFSDVQFSGTQSDINGLSNFGISSAAFNIVDTNHDGLISEAEALAIKFDSNSGNPNGQINYYRIFQSSEGAQFTKSEGTTYYLQDLWQSGRWSVNAGVRVEEWEHFATTGESIFTFEQEYAPRLSVVYDLKGDGRQRVSAYYGRYYDPIRNNMTNFAGSTSGRERLEQIFITTDAATGAGEWTTFRIRGGPTQPDANFAPTTQTPYTDEYQLGYKIDLGTNKSVEVNIIKRETRDILEDYELPLYADPAAYGLPVNHPDSLFLGLDYFGFTSFPNANFFIATLEGSARDWEGAEVIFRKRMSNNWQMLASYNYADATGNSNSDSNADFQGDVLWLDPQAINQEGTQPGMIESLFKVAGTYQFDNGFSVGAVARWNSGAIVSRTWSIFRRNLPVHDTRDPQTFDANGDGVVTCPQECIQFAGGRGTGVADSSGIWLSPEAVGKFPNPSYTSFDVRGSYLWQLGGRFEVDLFLDIFNILDDQATIRAQDLLLGDSEADFGEGLQFLEPRRYYLGARIRF